MMCNYPLPISPVFCYSDEDFDDVRIENTEQLPRFYKEKTGRLDIKIRLNDGRKIDVEMSFSDRHPCLSENTSFAIRQNIASARNHRRPWRSRYEASTDKEQNLINSDYMVTIYTNQLFCK